MSDNGKFAMYPLSNEVVAFTDTVASATAIGDDIHYVRLLATTDAHIDFVSAATTADMLLKANEAEYFKIPGGTAISVIESTAPGNLHVTQMDET